MAYTYGQIKTALQNEMETDETTFVSTLPDFIRNAEERIFKMVPLPVFRKNCDGNLSSGVRFLSTPDDYLAPYALSITVSGSKVFLDQKDSSFIQSYWPDQSSQGVPKYYAIYDKDSFIVGPTPNSAYTVELAYYYRPASLADGADSGTTWISTNAPDALFYGALVEACIFQRSDQSMIERANLRYQESIDRLKVFGEAVLTIDQYRYGLLTRPRT